MALGSRWIFKDRVTRWVPEKEAEESQHATEQPPPSVEKRLRRGQEEGERLRKDCEPAWEGDVSDRRG